MLAGAACSTLLLSGCGDGDDPYLNVVSDKRAPEVTVTVRDDAGDQVADITYHATAGRIPTRGTYAFFQTLDEGTWSTTHTLHDDDVIDGVPEGFDDPAFGGPGPDTYRLPDLDTEDTYRICIEFIVGRPARDAIGCSGAFHGS
jgi:hypothetical protein